MPTFKKGHKEDLPSLPLLPGKVMEHMILSTVTQHVQGNQALPAWTCERQVLIDQPDLLSMTS